MSKTAAQIVQDLMNDLTQTAIVGVMNQGKPAKDENGDCFYRTLDGQKCAVGMCIPDSRYNSEWEGKAVEDLSPFEFLDLTTEQKQALQSQDQHILDLLDMFEFLQTCHDGSGANGFRHDFWTKTRRWAEFHGFKMPAWREEWGTEPEPRP